MKRISERITITKFYCNKEFNVEYCAWAYTQTHTHHTRVGSSAGCSDVVAESGGCGCLPLASCVGSIALDVVAAVAVSGGCGCLLLAFRTRHLQCAAEELLLQELVPSYCVATGGR